MKHITFLIFLFSFPISMHAMRLQSNQTQVIQANIPRKAQHIRYLRIASFLEAYMNGTLGYDFNNVQHPELVWLSLQQNNPLMVSTYVFDRLPLAECAELLKKAEKKLSDPEYHKKIIDSFFLNFSPRDMITFENPSLFTRIPHGFTLLMALQLKRLKEYHNGDDMIQYVGKSALENIKEWRKDFRNAIYEKSMWNIKRFHNPIQQYPIQKKWLQFLLEHKIPYKKSIISD